MMENSYHDSAARCKMQGLWCQLLNCLLACGVFEKPFSILPWALPLPKETWLVMHNKQKTAAQLSKLSFVCERLLWQEAVIRNMTLVELTVEAQESVLVCSGLLATIAVTVRCSDHLTLQNIYHFRKYCFLWRGNQLLLISSFLSILCVSVVTQRIRGRKWSIAELWIGC